MSSKKEQIAELMVELFEGRKGSSAIRGFIKGEKIYAPYRDQAGIDVPLTKEVCLKHLDGEVSLGSYPLDQDDMVKWAAVDFDGKRGNPLEDAKLVKKSLEDKLGLICWLERSQSGKGIHLWMFFDKKYSAKVIRAVLSKHIPEYEIKDQSKRTSSFDRIFPHQDSAFGGYGNLCALPLNGADLVKNGKTAFVDETGNPLKEQSEVLLKIKEQINRTEVFDPFKDYVNSVSSTPVRRTMQVLKQVPGGAKLLSPVGCNWLRCAYKKGRDLTEPEWYDALGQFGRIEQGEVLAHKFSEPYPGYSPDATQKKFEHASEQPPIRVETVWERYGQCEGGCKCNALGLSHPWKLATVPISKLDEGGKGTVYDAKVLADTALALTKEIAEGKRMGYAWGYDLLDDHTELRPQNLIIVAARQGMGKTGILIDASIRGAERGIPQYIFSIEMGYEQLSMRYLSRLSGVDHTIITTGKVGKEDMIKIVAAHKKLRTLPIYVDDTTRDLDRMLDSAGELCYKNGKGPIWIDYLQLVRTKNGESKKTAVDRAVDTYKQMSKMFDVPVIALAQLNRSEEFAEGDDDMDSWLKDSGDIEQTADVIHYIRGPRQPGLVERRWRLHKERHRAAGINFKFLFHQGIFRLEPDGLWNKMSVKNEDLADDGFGGIR